MNEIHIKKLKHHLNHWKRLYEEHICEEQEGRETIEALQAAIKAMETEITWIVGNDNAQIAVRNMPVDKLQKICAIIGDELEPCEDAISRQAVDTLVDELARAISDEKCYISRGRSTATIMQDILDLPSVTPQSKIGRWILLDKCSNSGYYCSECHKKVVKEGWSNTIKKIKYCPNCGAKMEEGE